ncbi:MAG: hypothetical protein ACRC57_10630 [Sarcina sp.]
MRDGLKIINYTIFKIFNILIGIPLAFAVTTIILSICLVDLILLLLPVFYVINIFFNDLSVLVVLNNPAIQFIFTIIGTAMGYYLQKILRVYVPKYFKSIEAYIKNSFSFQI